MERFDLPEKEWNHILEHIDSGISDQDLIFQAWLSEKPSRQLLYAELINIRKNSSTSSFASESYKTRVWQSVLEKIEQEESQIRSSRRRIYLRIAACIAPILFLGAGYLLGTRTSAKQETASENLFALASNIEPGSKKARLVLNDGTMLDLGKQLFFKETDGTEVRNTPNSQLHYKNDDPHDGAKINTLIVPKGGEYKLLLSDGTKVWLNSGSILRYPTSFNSKERMVQLEGEAYFEVHKNPKVPFSVKVKGISLAVFGTTFNVNAYDPGKGISTTLVEGKVTMKLGDGRFYNINPRENITYNLETDTYKIEKDVDVTLYTSWKDGIFRFKNQRLEDITNRLSRWYSCEIVYTDESIRDMKFTGVAQRQEPVEHLLNLISEIKEIDYDVKDGVVFIGKRKSIK